MRKSKFGKNGVYSAKTAQTKGAFRKNIGQILQPQVFLSNNQSLDHLPFLTYAPDYQLQLQIGTRCNVHYFV